MFRFAFFRGLSYALAVITFAVIWWWVAGGAEYVNKVMALGERLTDALAEMAAQWRQREKWEVILVFRDKMGFNNTMVFSVVALLYSLMFELCFSFFAWSYWRWRLITHLYRTFFALVIVHGVLALWWVIDGNTALWWYDLHKAQINKVLTASEQHRAITFANALHIDGFVVFVEAVIVATLAVRFFHYIYLEWKAYMRVHW